MTGSFEARLGLGLEFRFPSGKFRRLFPLALIDFRLQALFSFLRRLLHALLMPQSATFCAGGGV
jgi:hypothetical protein